MASSLHKQKSATATAAATGPHHYRVVVDKPFSAWFAPYSILDQVLSNSMMTATSMSATYSLVQCRRSPFSARPFFCFHIVFARDFFCSIFPSFGSFGRFLPPLLLLLLPLFSSGLFGC